MKKSLFGSRADKYEYLPSVKAKSPIQYESDSENEETVTLKRKMPDYCKVKFKMFQTSDNQRVNETVIKTRGTVMKADTITDITQYLKFKSTARFTIRFQKIWAMHTTCYRGKIPYSLGLVLEEVDINNFTKFVNYGIPICHLDGLREAYKKYVEEKSVKKQLAIEI